MKMNEPTPFPKGLQRTKATGSFKGSCTSTCLIVGKKELQDVRKQIESYNSAASRALPFDLRNQRSVKLSDNLHSLDILSREHGHSLREYILSTTKKS